MKFLVGSLLILLIINGKNVFGLNNGPIRAISRVYDQCENSEDIIKCFKIQGAKFLGRALKVQNIKLLDGITIVKKSNSDNNERVFSDTVVKNSDLENMSSKSLDQMLFDRIGKFVGDHQVQVNVPRLLSVGEERGKKMKKYLGPFIAAVMLKAGILKMAYHSIAIVAGKALLVGKIALIISAVIGLKKLVSTEGHEKTTYEIVKHPHVSQSHTYSSSSQGDYEGHDSGGSGSSYHRSIGEEEMLMQDKAYRGHMPRS